MKKKPELIQQKQNDLSIHNLYIAMLIPILSLRMKQGKEEKGITIA